MKTNQLPSPLRRARQSAGFTLFDAVCALRLAKLDASESTIHRWEKGKAKPSPDQRRALLAAYAAAKKEGGR